MKWVKKKYKLKKNQTRVIKRFLLFPKTLDEVTRWLEVAKIHQAVIEHKNGRKWLSINYVDKKDKL